MIDVTIRQRTFSDLEMHPPPDWHFLVTFWTLVGPIPLICVRKGQINLLSFNVKKQQHLHVLYT